MKNLTLISIAASGLVLLAGCGGGGSSDGMQSSNSGSVGAAPVTPTPVTPVAPVTPAPEPTPVPVVKPDFTEYVSKMVAAGEADEPAATDDVEFVFADEENEAAFAALLESM